MKKFIRSQELSQLKGILSSEKSEFLYLRGRRRVGKSWLLSELQNGTANCFLFTGEADASTKLTVKRMTEQWSDFSQTQILLQLRQDFLSWKRIFDEMLEYAKSKKQKLTLIFDEVQWIAKKGNGFIGAVKAAWVPWQQSSLINVIICGSSNRFFNDHVGGEEKILRGLQTAATIWVRPLGFTRIREEFAPHWKLEEVALLYMMIGGVPYYLERVDPSLPFVHAINQAFFTASRNLLSEPEELLSLEFNRLGRVSVMQLLSSLGQTGSSHSSIARKTGLPKPTVSKLLQHLVNYRLLYIRKPFHRPRREREDFERYYMKDFFLNFYFQVLRPLEKDILANHHGLLFPYRTGLSKTGYYIPNFTGAAFELLVRYLLEDEQHFSSALFKQLHLVDPNYSVRDYWDQQTQIDLLVEHEKDRVLRTIECKWGESWSNAWIDEILKKNITHPNHYTQELFIFLPQLPAQDVQEQARSNYVTLLGLDQLFV